MSIQGAFQPQGPCTLVDNTARQPLESGSGQNQSVRVRNLATTTQYFTWGTTSAVTSAGAPTGGTPSANTIGMIGTSVETFSIPSGAWMIASSATGFEVICGEGL